MEVNWLAFSWLVFVAFCSAAPLTDNRTIRADEVEYRLLEHITPSHYEIEIKPYLHKDDGDKRFTFDGKVTITVKSAIDNVNEIILHAKKLVISKITLNGFGIDEIEVTNSPVDDLTDKIVLEWEGPALQKNIEYFFTFEYVGQMDEDMHGFYRSKYVDEKGKDVWIGSTQFQPVHARRAFPCFDEPKFKATFSIKINRPKDYESVSNTKLKETVDDKDDKNRAIDTYEDTPKMSTYLIAFIISNFKERSNKNKDFIVIARPGAYEQTEYSFDMGPKLLKKLDEYTDFPYKDQMKKMHLAAIPDFSAGAMENWGLLTYRETALLYDPKGTTAKAEQSIAAVIAHEQAHMWFGDLVTCDWWGYTWLNEGFARYFQYFTTHEVNPDWEMDKQFVVEQIHSVFNMDSTKKAHKLSDPDVASPADIAKMFDSISYNKGASIIRMILHAMTESKFKAAIQEYLDKEQYKTSTPDILFSYLKKEFENEKVDFEVFLEDWTENVGYPVVTIELSEDGKEFTAQQKRFLLNNGKDSLLYTVPLTYTTNVKPNFKDTEPQEYLKKTSSKQKFKLKEKTDWIIANIQQTGYYRVNYDDKTWHNIHAALLKDDFSSIHELNRAQIVDDLLNFGRSGLKEYDFVFSILEYLTHETSYLPWYPALNGLSTLEIRLGKEDREIYSKYILNLIKDVYAHLGFDEKADDKRLDIYNRANIISVACKYGHTECVTKSKEYFKKLTDDDGIPVNIRSNVYCTGIREGSDEDFDKLWDKYIDENVATEKVLILTALGCTKSEDKLKEYLKNILSDDVRLQDKSSALSGTYTGNTENVAVVFKYVTENYEEVKEAFGSYSDVASILSSISSRFTTNEELKELETFLKDHKEDFDTASTETLNSAITNVKENIKWSEERLPKFVDYLKVATRGGASTISVSLSLIVPIAVYSILRFL